MLTPHRTEPQDYTTEPVEGPVDTTFKDVEPIYRQELNRYLLSHTGTLSGVGGVDREELLSVLFESFLVAYDGYVRKKGPFPRRVRAIARYSIKEFFRSRKNKIKLPQGGPDLSVVPVRVAPFDLADFLSSLQGDAHRLAQTALHIEGLERLKSDERKKRILVQTLLYRGWSHARIASAWGEVSRVLAGYAAEKEKECRKRAQQGRRAQR